VNKYPKIKLVDNPKQDAQLGVNFIKLHKGSSRKHLSRFLPDELLDVLDKNIPAKIRDRRVRLYALRRHRTDHAKISRNLREIKKDWKRVEGKYFRLVDKIFKKHPWPPGKYVGYTTVFWMYPRNISDKTFYFPYRHRKAHFANKTIAHEALHFIFFEYVKEIYGIDWKKEKSYGRLWKLSEAFNTAMENWTPYKKLFIYGGTPYSGTEEMTKKISKQWSRQKDIDKLLDKWLKKRIIKS